MRIETPSRNFETYFLRAQREGHEVYLGKGIALVVYKEDQTIGIQCDDRCFLWNVGAVFYQIADFAGSDLEKELLKIRKPENLTGIREDLTSKIGEMYISIVCFIEDCDPC